MGDTIMNQFSGLQNRFIHQFVKYHDCPFQIYVCPTKPRLPVTIGSGCWGLFAFGIRPAIFARNLSIHQRVPCQRPFIKVMTPQSYNFIVTTRQPRKNEY